MKKLEKLKNNLVQNLKVFLEQCSNCGYCKADCIIYKLSNDEYYSPRAKVAIIKAYLNGEIKDLNHILKILDLCIFCMKCHENCKSKVDLFAIFSGFKYLFYQNYSSKKEQNLISDLLNKYCSQPQKTSFAKSSSDIIFFPGCAFKRICESDLKLFSQLMKLLKKDVLILKDECCGFFHSMYGFIENSINLKNRLFNIINSFKPQTIITPCPFCKFTLKYYFPGLQITSLTEFFNQYVSGFSKIKSFCLLSEF